MRTEQEIEAELAAAMQTHHETAADMTAKQQRESTEVIQALRRELSSLLSAGAVACPKCNAQPQGMHKTKARWKESPAKAGATETLEQVQKDVYCVYCFGCQPSIELIRTEDEPGGASFIQAVQITIPEARGETVAAAVAAWNAGTRETRQEIRRFAK